MTKERRGDWIETVTGKRFWPLDPRPEDVDIVDIAHALSMICRYNGHVDRFYSVATHSMLVATHVAAMLPDRPDVVLQALLHDAPEAYIGDNVRPLKKSIPALEEAEALIWTVVAEVFGLPLNLHPLIVDTDNRILWDERRELKSQGRHIWTMPDGSTPLYIEIPAMEPQESKSLFLYVAKGLIEKIRSGPEPAPVAGTLPPSARH